MIISRRDFTRGGSLLLAGAWGTGIRAAASKPIVETSGGKVRGVLKDGVYAFKAIPYAGSTAGANRFMPPVALTRWAGVRDCSTWGPIAPQGVSTANPSSGMGQDFTRFFGIGSDVPTAQSEDCLILNIFTPGLRDRKRPVMVWIHGGGFAIGSGSGARADGTHLAKRQDVVTVSLNHRLGVLGYCHLGEFDPAFEHSGNAGQLDLIAALNWVHENIEAFGGDPKRIMVNGESGGAGKIATLLAMPKARGLFARAALQSGSANHLPTRDQAAEWAEGLLKELQVPKNDVRQLQKLPFAALIAAASKMDLARIPGPRRGFVPTMGTVDLPKAPIDAVREGSARIPLIIGNTQHEMATMLLGMGVDPRKVTPERLQGQTKGMFGDKAAAIVEGYGAIHPDYTPGDLLVRIWSDTMRMGSIQLAEAHVQAGGAPTYMYLFTWQSPVLPYMKAAHGIDGTFYFDNVDSVEITRGNLEAQAIATRASTAWASFARDGKPVAPGLPAWPAYDLAKRETMVFAGAPHVESDPLRADRALRERLAVDV
jgi:para-nitrobenzyl esterase